MHDGAGVAVFDPAAFLRRRLPEQTYRNLAMEGRALRAQAELIVSDECVLEEDGAVNGRGRCHISGPRDHLRSFHTGLGLDIAREFAGCSSELFPTRTSYLFYDEGDFSFFHHDAVHAHVTVIVGLSDGLLPLALYPHFGRVSNADVANLNGISNPERSALSNEMLRRFGQRARASEVEVRDRHALAIGGRRVPHARPLQPVQGTVCTACYAFISPAREWLLD
jgi:hypothetical protein